MKQNDFSIKIFIKKIFVAIVVVILFGIVVQTLSDTPITFNTVTAQENTWSIALQISETTGRATTVVFGGSPNASNDQDDLDLAEPPTPPELSYIQAWFATSLPVPFNRLLHEYKQIPSVRMEWNLSLLWVPEPGNDSRTVVTIRWDPAQITQSSYNSFNLYKNRTMIADMLTESSYSFPSNGTIHQFQIIGKTIPKNSTSTNNNLPILQIALGITVLLIITIIVAFLYKRKK